MMNETLVLELVGVLRAIDEKSAEATDGYVTIPTELWNEIMEIYDIILAEEAAQK